ncbi:MAG: putative two-component system response regulator [Pseudonocardiales bacterium]|jgi:DNA-binding NarL/FixJ family response regulator|nr:putative two-component system response regulator [Pseudonocardiales bacterium]
MNSTTEVPLTRLAAEPASSLTSFPATPYAHAAAIRLLIIDGRPLVRWALAHIADDLSDLVTVGQAGHATEARELTVALHADVVTIDCSLPDGQGWQLARDLRDRHPELGIVLLIAEGSDDLLFRALDSGASAYLPKDAPVHEVLSAIRHSAIAASSFSASGLAQAMRRKHAATDSVLLSPRESQVLALLREGRSVPEVAATLYVSLSTAKTYVARLYDKLGSSNRAQALMTAVRLGLFDDHPIPVS